MRNLHVVDRNAVVRNQDGSLSAAADKKLLVSAYLSATPFEMELIRAIRRYGEITKGDLISSTIYSRSKINSCIASLLKKDYIRAAGAGDYTGGRRSVKFSMNGELGLVAGVDIGATSIDIVLADLAGKMFARFGEPGNVREGPAATLDRVCCLLDDLLVEIGWPRDRLYGIGIGVPGPVDFERG
jgi:hypothetical protein